jgi:hypothetical protein
MNSPGPAIREFAQRLAFLLMFRTALRCATVWLLGVGVAVLVARVTGLVASHWLIGGLAGLVPVISVAAWLEWRRRPQLAAVRAAMDRHNRAGGLLMAANEADVSAWQNGSRLAQPGVRRNSGRPITLFAAAALFLGASMLMPERFIVGAAPRPLDVGKLVTELTEQITALPMGPLSSLKDAQLVGISRSAPEVTGDKETAQAGALTGAEAGGGAANVQQLLPRHKGAVQRFFKREN